MVYEGPLTGRLENWFYDKEKNRIIGEIFDDSRKRYDDGELIWTTLVVEVVGQPFKHEGQTLLIGEIIKEGSTIRTERQSYLLGKKAEE